MIRPTLIHSLLALLLFATACHNPSPHTKVEQAHLALQLMASPPGKELSPEVVKALSWLHKAQAKDGGWGAGAHARQNVRNPHAVKTDPATTAFVAMALLRAGNTLTEGQYHANLSQALDYLLNAVEDAKEQHTNITKLQGTQPQVKLGQNIDVAMTSQFFTRILPIVDVEREERLEHAIEICLERIQNAQDAQGGMAGGTWAGVLQDAMANNALEEAKEFGFRVADSVVEKARANQAQNVDRSGAVLGGKSAGVSLYTYSSTVRATAKEAKRAKSVIKEAYDRGDISQEYATADDVPVNTEVLLDAGLSLDEAQKLERDFGVNAVAAERVQDKSVQAGFGNNGGEEFLSHMMTSESMYVMGGDSWEKWEKDITATLNKIQNPDGSWSGHHCITSPVFCTAACVLTLTVDRDASLLTAKE
ncbi:MAG: hypothetical protein AAF206_07910 [Bacteroidota bacterium]